MKLELLVHKGIKINGEHILLGMNINDIKLNEPMKKSRNSYYLYDNCLQIGMENGLIYDITCCIGEASMLRPIFAGKSLYNIEAEAVIELLSKELKENPVITEIGHSYTWKRADVSCWRQITPEEAQEVLEESKEDGDYEEMKEDIEKDILRAKVFDTITIGIEGSYEDVEEDE